MKAEEIRAKMNEAYKEYDYAFNVDVASMSTWCDWNDLEMYKFDRADDVWTDGKVRIKLYTFKQIGLPYVVGMNSFKGEAMVDQLGVFYDSELNEIYCHTDKQLERLTERIEEAATFDKEWKAFKALKLNVLGEQFPVGESVYWYFLECMPPIYVSGGFAMSEPLSHRDGKPTYYVFRGVEGDRTVEVNFAK